VNNAVKENRNGKEKNQSRKMETKYMKLEKEKRGTILTPCMCLK